VRLADFDPAFGRDVSRVDGRDRRRQHRAQQAFEHGADDERIGRARQLTVVAHADAFDACGAHLADERTQAPRHVGKRLQPLKFVRGERRKIDGVSDHAGLEKIPQRGRGFHTDQFLAFARRCGNVRRGHHLRQLLEPVVFGRFVLEHVERRAPEVPGLDRVGQRPFVNQIAPGRVDDSHPLLAGGQAGGVEDVAGFRRRGHVQREKVGALAQLVERDEFDAEISGDVGIDVRVVGEDVHLERPGAPCHFLTDAAEPGQAERLAAQLLAEKAFLIPLALLHRGIGRRGLSGKCQQHRHRQLRNADAVGPGRVHDHDATRAGGRHIDVVHTRAGSCDGPEIFPAAIRSAVTFVALRTTMASASRDRWRGRPARGRCVRRRSILRGEADRARKQASHRRR
jgi:hypothetical protein